jgi:hypothetical protein
MTLSLLLYALMVCSLAALIGLLVVDGIRDRVKRFRPLGIATPASPCVSGRTRHGSQRMSRPGRARDTSGLRRR